MSVRKLFLTVSVVVVMLFAGALLASRNTQDVLFRALGNLAEVVHLVESEYVDELNQEALAMALDSGLVEGLDRSAAVLPPDQVGDYLELVDSPPPFGLGLTSRLGSAAVQFTLTDSPAETSGLDLWEVIELVDGVNSRGRPLWQIRLQLREAQNRGLPVALTVFDREVDERREVVLEPTDWTPRAASAELHDEGTVIHVEAIPAGATESIAELLPEEGRAILDLRELRWGVEEETITLADSFIGEGMIGEWKGRRAGSRAYTATADALANEPPIVLVGPMTEGVGEILAAALQRHGALVVGQKTRGHAPYMSLVRDGDVAVWMPVGQWLRADEEPIEKNGIVPDEEIEAGAASDEQDPVLDRALRILASDSEVPEEEELEEAA